MEHTTSSEPTMVAHDHSHSVQTAACNNLPTTSCIHNPISLQSTNLVFAWKISLLRSLSGHGRYLMPLYTTFDPIAGSRRVHNPSLRWTNQKTLFWRLRLALPLGRLDHHLKVLFGTFGVLAGCQDSGGKESKPQQHGIHDGKRSISILYTRKAHVVVRQCSNDL